MRTTFTILFLIFCFALHGQDLNQVKRANNNLAIPVAKKQIVIGSDTSYMQQYANLEIRDDSLCLVGGSCLLLVIDTTRFLNLANSELTQTDSLREYDVDNGNLEFKNGVGFNFRFHELSTISDPFSIEYYDDGKLQDNFGAGNHYLFRSQLELQAGSDNTSRRGALLGQAVINSSTHSDVVGFYGNVKNESGTVTNQRAGYLANVTNGTGSATNSQGLYIQVTNTGSGTVTDAHGVLVSPVATGTMTKFTGYEIGPKSGTGFDTFLGFVNEEPTATSFTRGGWVIGSSNGLMGNYRLVVDANGSNDPVRIYDIQNDDNVSKIWGSSATDGVLKSVDKYTFLDTVNVLATQYDLTQISTVDYQDLSVADDSIKISNGIGISLSQLVMDLSLVDNLNGTYTISLNGGNGPFFNSATMDALLSWNISGNSIGINLDDDLSQYDNSTSGFLTSADQYWTLSGSDIYRSSKVAINTTTLSTYADLIIGGKHIDFASTSNSSFIGRSAGQNNTQVSQMGIGFEALMNGTGGTSTAIGYQAGKNNSGSSLVAIGHISGQSNSGINNVFIGYLSGTNNTTGGTNTFIGSNSGLNNTTGERNTLIGYNTTVGTDVDRCVYIGYECGLSSTGDFNTAIGTFSGRNQTGIFNTSVGYNALSSNTGSNNTAIGTSAGSGNASGSSNVFIGYQAGQNETGSNNLYIDNTNTSSPLIYGNFSTNELEINGTLETTGKIRVGDTVEGNAVNIIGQDSEGDLTRISQGSGIDLTTGTLSVDWTDAPADVQTLASAYMNTIDYEAADYPSYLNIAIATERHDGGDLSVNTSFEQIEVDSDGGGYYIVQVQGEMSCTATGGVENSMTFYTKVGSTYEYIGDVYAVDALNHGFSIQSTILFSNNDDVVLSIKSPTSAAAGIEFTNLKWEMIKI